MTSAIKRKRILEGCLLFIGIPIILSTHVHLAIKIGLGLIGFGYSLRILLIEKYPFYKIAMPSISKVYLRQIGINMAIVIAITTAYTYVISPENLFRVLLERPILFTGVLFVYIFLSVPPQEILYRSFFFSRYGFLFQNKKLLILTNALLFSLAHLFFYNTIVLIITFIGGLIFAYSFHRNQSIFWVSVEHALYGSYLFIVGMGGILGFPGT